MTDLRQAEPVAWIDEFGNVFPLGAQRGPKHLNELMKPLYTTLPLPVQEPVTWRNAAIRVGEDLCSVGPFGYYDMTAEQWLDWALSVVTVHAPPPQRKPLPPQSPCEMTQAEGKMFRLGWLECEAAHGIKETKK